MLGNAHAELHSGSTMLYIGGRYEIEDVFPSIMVESWNLGTSIEAGPHMKRRCSSLKIVVELSRIV